MKLYLIVYLAGQIMAVLGPVPYDERECWRRVDTFFEEQRQTMQPPAPHTKDDIVFKCEWLKQPPKLSEQQ